MTSLRFAREEPRSPNERGGLDQARQILIVEDDLETTETIAAILESEGYEIATARDGRDALERLNDGAAPDLILLDLRMPVMDGWTFRIAQRRNSALAPIPVIAMSADGTPEAAAISADAFLKKPFSMPDLLGAVERVLAASERQRQAERWTLVERMASLGQVAAGVGHEINNPLAFVLLNVMQVRDALRGGGGTAAGLPELVDRLDESLVGLERIRGIVQNLQRLSRAPDPKREPVRLDEVLNESITLARSHLTRAKVIKRFADAPAVAGSAGALGQVFLNLLINAAQALPDGGASDAEVSVTLAFDGTDVTVEIADTGRGIPPEILPRIFDPFFTTKGSAEGTGLGLTICKRIVTDHGGDLTIESDAGRGTVCRVSLKPAPDAAARPSAAPALAPSAPAAAQRGRILVIDDEALIGRVIQRSVAGRHEVVFVEDARAAFDMLEQGTPFDVVLCDLTMPGLSGSEVFEVLVARWPALASRLVFMTGGAFTERARAYLDETKRPVLYKPFSVTELATLLDEQLKSAAGRDGE